LTKFMETVESATAAIPDAMIEDAEEASRAPEEPESTPRRGRRAPAPAESDEEIETGVAAAAATPAGDPWSALLQTGMALLQQLALDSLSPPCQQERRAVARPPGDPQCQHSASSKAPTRAPTFRSKARSSSSAATPTAPSSFPSRRSAANTPRSCASPASSTS